MWNGLWVRVAFRARRILRVTGTCVRVRMIVRFAGTTAWLAPSYVLSNDPSHASWAYLSSGRISNGSRYLLPHKNWFFRSPLLFRVSSIRSFGKFVCHVRVWGWIVPVIRLETIENRANVYDMDVGNDHENRGGYTMSRENLAATWWKYMLYMWEKRENFVCDIKELRLVAA